MSLCARIPTSLNGMFNHLLSEKGFKMKLWISSWLLGSLAFGVMISASPGSANAGTRSNFGPEVA